MKKSSEYRYILKNSSSKSRKVKHHTLYMFEVKDLHSCLSSCTGKDVFLLLNVVKAKLLDQEWYNHMRNLKTLVV